MQFEFDYWYEAWEKDWQESLAYAFKRMKEKFEYESWARYHSL